MTSTVDREGFHRAISASLEARANGEQLAIVVVCLRKLHRLNARFGYDEVDTLLKKVSDSIDKTLRKAVHVTRIGDGSFGLILPNLSSPNLVIIALDRVLESIGRAFEVGDHKIKLDANAGAAVFPAHGVTATQLMMCAESAMHAARAAGQPSRLHNSLGDKTSLEEWAFEGDLEAALPQRQLLLNYHPQLDLHSNQITNGEALMRWQHPSRGLVPPDLFISLAESKGLLNAFTEWALQTALREIASLEHTGKALSVAVNVSPPSLFDPEFPLIVESALSIWNMPPERLIIEITESVLMTDPETCHEILSGLRAKGIRVSIDDFGTGYSSLAYFKTIPADELKIDRSFVSNMLTNDSDASIVELIIDLAHKFDLKVVAEGVEDQKTQAALASLGCDFAQGYHISKPLARDDFEKWLCVYPDH